MNLKVELKEFIKYKVTEKPYGFTLIELLIVVAIIGILAAIAIPQFATYRIRAYNATANTDMSFLRKTEEAMYAEFQDYGSSAVTTSTMNLITGSTTNANQSIMLSNGIHAGVKVLQSDGKNVSYCISVKHVLGDVVSGAETEFTGLYRNNIDVGTVLTDSDVPDATQGTDFISPWNKVQ